ncbi:NADP-dependent oxidoreductase [Nocardiopsis synnemataformans]|uniref:NADP-dependent oxidoreductase n=1 Tax=Nocardiopsis synnemataformans TaxID=61305 RepID=UPI003EB6CE69
MTTMRAAAIDRFGPADLLTERDLPRPAAGPGEVLVRVRAAGVQPTDAAIRGGWVPPGAVIGFPQILGNEFAGVVEEVGPDADGFAPGDEVAGFRVLGCYAEYVAVPADQIAHKPAGVPWPVAGALSASGQTAHTALELLRVARGETLLVHGAAGGVGSMAVQLAVERGARVVGTASAANLEYVRSLGAVAVEYGDGQLDRVREAAPEGVDAAFDTAGHDNLRTAVRLVSDRDRVGTIVDMGLVQDLGCRWIRSDRSAARLRELLDLCAGGRLHVTVRRTLPLSGAADAHRDVETGHGRGKIALVVGDEATLT